ncbi:MAG: site-specific integrase [Ignavibacteriaceae bacterium]
MEPSNNIIHSKTEELIESSRFNRILLSPAEIQFSEQDIQKIKLFISILGGGMQMNSKRVEVEQGISEYEKLAKFNLAPKTVSGIKTACGRFLEFIAGNRLIDTIERKDAENLLMKISKSAPLGVYNYLRVYKTMFNVFLDWNYISKNPFLAVKLPKRQIQEPTVFKNEQINIVCEKLIEKGKEVIADIIRFGVVTGLRPGEETNLRWNDIDFKNKVITVGNKFFNTKTKRIRRIPFNKTMEEILKRNSRRQLNNGKIIREFVFTQKNGKQYKVDNISKTVKKVIREAGLPEELHLYCTRATAATRWANNKVPIFTVSKLLGHSRSDTTTRFYAGIDIEELRDAVNRL